MYELARDVARIFAVGGRLLERLSLSVFDIAKSNNRHEEALERSQKNLL